MVVFETSSVRVDCQRNRYSNEQIFCDAGHGKMIIYYGQGLYSAIAVCESCGQYRYKIGNKWLERGESK